MGAGHNNSDRSKSNITRLLTETLRRAHAFAQYGIPTGMPLDEAWQSSHRNLLIPAATAELSSELFNYTHVYYAPTPR